MVKLYLTILKSTDIIVLDLGSEKNKRYYMNLSRKFLFAGNVQGVGFRAKVCSYAQNFKVTGYVKNMPTGDVEVYVEGSSLEIERFLEKIY